jgi:hypothetical protein
VLFSLDLLATYRQDKILGGSGGSSSLLLAAAELGMQGYGLEHVEAECSSNASPGLAPQTTRGSVGVGRAKLTLGLGSLCPPVHWRWGPVPQERTDHG